MSDFQNLAKRGQEIANQYTKQQTYPAQEQPKTVGVDELRSLVQPFKKRLEQVEEKPEFREKSYEEQQKLRAYWFQDKVAKDALDQGADPRIIQNLYKRVLDRPPKYSTPQNEQFATGMMKMFDTLKEGKAWAEGFEKENGREPDPEEVKRAGFDTGGFLDLAIRGGMSMQGAINRGSIMTGGLYKLADWFTGDKHPELDMMVGPDSNKFQAHFQNQLEDLNSRSAKLHGIGQYVGQIGGMASDYILFNLATKGLVSSLGGKLFNNFVKNMKGSKRSGLYSLLDKNGAVRSMFQGGSAAIVDAAIDGGFEVARQNIQGMLQEDDTLTTNTLGEVAKAYGIGAAFDLAIGLSASTLIPFFGASTRTLYKKFGSQKVNKSDITQKIADSIERLDDTYQIESTSDPMLRAFKKAQSENFQAINTFAKQKGADQAIDRIREARRAGEDASSAKIRVNQVEAISQIEDDPLLSLRLNAMSGGSAVDIMEDGSYKLYHIDPESGQVIGKNLRNFDEAMAQIGELSRTSGYMNLSREMWSQLSYNSALHADFPRRAQHLYTRQYNSGDVFGGKENKEIFEYMWKKKHYLPAARRQYVGKDEVDNLKTKLNEVKTDIAKNTGKGDKGYNFHSESGYVESQFVDIGDEIFPSNVKTRIHRQLQQPNKPEWKLFRDQTSDGMKITAKQVAPDKAAGVGVLVRPANQKIVDEAAKEIAGKTSKLADDVMVRNRLISWGYDGVIDNAGDATFFFPEHQIKYIMPDVNAKTGLPQSGIPKEDSLFKDINTQVKSQRFAEFDPDYIMKDPDRSVRMFDAVREVAEADPEQAARVLNKMSGGKPPKDGELVVKRGEEGGAINIFSPDGKVSYTASLKAMRERPGGVFAAVRSRYMAGGEGYSRYTRQSRDIYTRRSLSTLPALDNIEDIRKWVAAKSTALGGTKSGDRLIKRMAGTKNPKEQAEILLNEKMTHRAAKNIFESRGYKFVRKEDGTYIARNGKESFSGNTPYQTLENAGIKDFKLPKELGPQGIGVSPDGKLRIMWNENNVIEASSKSKLLKTINSFEDYDATAMQTPIGQVTVKGKNVKANLLKNTDDTIQLEISEAGINREFGSLEEAKRFANEWYTNFKDLESTAVRRGLKISYHSDKQQWVIYDGTTTKTVNSSDELMQTLRGFPEMHGAPNILDSLDPTIEADVRYIVENMRKQIAGHLGASGYDFYDLTLGGQDDIVRENLKKQIQYNMESGMKQRKALEPLQNRLGSMRQVMKNLYDGGHKQLGSLLDDIDSNLQLMRRHVESLRHQLDDIFTRQSDGKIMPREERVKVRGLIEARYGGEEKVFWEDRPKVAGTMKQTDIEKAAERLQELYGTTPLEGLSSYFNIPLSKYVFDYVPRKLMHIDQIFEFRKAVGSASNKDDLFKVLKNRAQEGVPQELKNVAKKMRTQEMASILTDRDPYHVTLKYIETGLRDKMIGVQWKQVYKYVNDHAEELGPDMIQRLNLYRDMLTGSYVPQSEKAIAEFLGRMRIKRWTKNNKKLLDQAVKDGEMSDLERDLSLVSKDTETLGRDLMRTFYSLNYFTNMSFRPWLALRNTHQIFTTLGARFGFGNTTDAVREIYKNPEYWYKMARDHGALRTKAPVGIEVSESGSFMGASLEKGLWMFANSDDFTRTIAFVTARRGLDKAVNAQRVARINPRVDGWDNFDSISKLEMDHPMARKQVHDMLNRSGVFEGGPVNDEVLEAAKVSWGRRVALETMFDYDPTNKPQIFANSWVGKLFGMYGTYSVGYRENLINALKYAPKAARRGFVFRFLAIHGALFGAFSAAGIRADNFLPGMPALFSGGPLYHLGSKMVNSLNPSYDGRESRYELNRLLSPVAIRDGELQAQYPSLAPGSLQFKYAKDALEAFNDGDAYRGIMHLNTFPMKDPNDGWLP